MISYNNPVNMGSSLVISVVVKDEAGITMTPTTTIWSLLDESGGIVHSREDEEVIPSRAMTINLTKYDTQLPTGSDYATRTVRVTSAYLNKTGDSIDVVDTLSFQINRV